MPLTSKSTLELLTLFGEIKVLLRGREVIRSERLTGEIGEWFAQKAYHANPAKTVTQKGYDLVAGGKTIQVKSHARGDNNPHRSTELRRERINDFDILVIIVMSPSYRIEEWYEIPQSEIESVAKDLGKKKIQTLIKWDEIKRFRVPPENLPGYTDIEGFITSEA